MAEVDAVDLKDAERNSPSAPVKNSAGEEVVTGAEELGVGQVQAKMDIVHNQGFYGGDDAVSSVDTSHTVAAVTGNLEVAVDEPTHATPAAEALAEELGVDLSHVEGSGASGDVLVSDVKAAAEAEEG